MLRTSLIAITLALSVFERTRELGLVRAVGMTTRQMMRMVLFEGAIIAAFGAYYDIPLLRKECGRYDLDYRTSIAGGAFDIRAVATVWLAANNHRTSGLTLNSILEKMGLGDRFTAHRAVEDAKAAAAVLQMHHLGHALD